MTKRPRQDDIAHFVNASTPHRFARYGGAWVCAWEEDPLDGRAYSCDCVEPHRMKLVKPSGRADRRSFAGYFAHVAEGAGGGGESMLHRNAKHMLRVWMSAPMRTIAFATEACVQCRSPMAVRTFASSDYRVELERRSADGQWRYDCTLVDRTSNATIAALEVMATHACTVSKIEGTHLLLAEFKAREVTQEIEYALASQLEEAKLTNLILPKRRRCVECVLMECQTAMHQVWRGEQMAWTELEALCMNEWERLDVERAKEREAFRIQRARVTQVERFQEAVLKQCPLLPTQHAELIVEHFGDNMLLDTRNGFLAIWNQKRVPLPGMGDYFISFKSNYGRDFKTPGYALLLVDDSWLISGGNRLHGAMRHVWQKHDIPRENVLAIRSDYIVRRASDIQTAHLDGTFINFKNWLFPLLKKCEDAYQICANCGDAGHRHSECGLRICARCKRKGHLSRECFAKRSVDGTPL
jgi:hypothetical protein